MGIGGRVGATRQKVEVVVSVAVVAVVVEH